MMEEKKMKKKIIPCIAIVVAAAAVVLTAGCNLFGDTEYMIEDLVFRLGSEDGDVLEDGAVIDIDVYADPAEEYTIVITVPGEGISETGLGRGITHSLETTSYYNSTDILDITATQSGVIQDGNPNYLTIRSTSFRSGDTSTMIADGIYDHPLSFTNDSDDKIFEILFRTEFDNFGSNQVLMNVPGDIYSSEVKGREYLFEGLSSAKVAARFGDTFGVLGGGTAWEDVNPLNTYQYPTAFISESLGGNTTYISDGDYYSLFYIDADESGMLNTGETGVFKPVTVAGDLLIEITADELSAAVTESFSMINGGSLPDGALVIRFVVPNGGKPDSERDQVTYSIAGLSSGSLTPSVDGPIIPGTYGIFAYIDEEPGYDLSGGTTDWDLDIGEYYLELGEVVIDGSGVVLDGSQFVQLN